MADPAQRQRVVGKRQVRPNLTRADFGYVERTRINKPKKQKQREEDDGENGAGTSEGRSGGGRSDKEARNLVRAPRGPTLRRAATHAPCARRARPRLARPRPPPSRGRAPLHRRSTSPSWTWRR